MLSAVGYRGVHSNKWIAYARWKWSSKKVGIRSCGIFCDNGNENSIIMASSSAVCLPSDTRGSARFRRRGSAATQQEGRAITRACDPSGLGGLSSAALTGGRGRCSPVSVGPVGFGFDLHYGELWGRSAP